MQGFFYLIQNNNWIIVEGDPLSINDDLGGERTSCASGASNAVFHVMMGGLFKGHSAIAGGGIIIT